MTFDALQTAANRLAPIVANHLWQSTLFAVLAAIATLAFRRNHAQVRFGLWLAASIKFLIPLALLVSLGNQFATPHPYPSTDTAYTVLYDFSQPFTQQPQAPNRTVNLRALLPALLIVIWLSGAAAVLCIDWVRWRRISALIQKARPSENGREVDALRQLEQIGVLRQPIALLVSQDSMEPGIYGIFRPALVWPAGISEHLPDAHLRAILSHELWHIRRRDNFFAALHMAVEAVFWFHPLVWWVGARLVEERERACDEQVLRLGNQPEIYAESILRACKFCVESPLSCVSGVAGSNLKRRVTRIMKFQSAQNLTPGRKLLLATAAAVALFGPVAFGVLHAPQLAAQTPYVATLPRQSFEKATVKPSQATGDQNQMEIHSGHFTDNNVTVRKLIEFAYGIEGYRLAGGPAWIDTDRFDIEATWNESAAVAIPMSAGPPPPPPPPGRLGQPLTLTRPGQLQAMVQSLLADRFNLRLNQQSQTLPIYELVVADTGARLTPATQPTPSFKGEPIISVRRMVKDGVGEISVDNAPVEALTGQLSDLLDRRVIDKTGLKGPYNMALHWTTGENAKESVIASVQEQLGLKLESQQGVVDIFVINQIDRPAEN